MASSSSPLSSLSPSTTPPILSTSTPTPSSSSMSSSSSSSSSSAVPSPPVSPETPASSTLLSYLRSGTNVNHSSPNSSDQGKSSTEKLPTNGNDLKLSPPPDCLMIDDLADDDDPPVTQNNLKKTTVQSIGTNGGIVTTSPTTVKGGDVIKVNGIGSTLSSPTRGIITMGTKSGITKESVLEAITANHGSSVKNIASNGGGNGTCVYDTSNGKSLIGSRLRSISYVNSDHLPFIFDSMNRMRRNGQLCDITLEVDGSHLKAHKVVLSATSAYFNAMFNSEMSEKNKSVIILHDIEYDALKSLVDYAYSGEINISEENVQALLPTASLLQVSSVREACCKFLLRQLDPTNCLGIRHFADAHSCEELHQTSEKFVVENFPAVAKTEEFLLLPYNEVEDLISSNHLNVHDENEVYNAVIRWVKYDLKSREGRLGCLLQHIRFPLIHKNTLLNHVCKEPLMEGSPDGKDLLIEAMRYHLSPDERFNIKNIRTQHRRPKGLKTYIFSIGGGSLFAIHNECEFYDPVTDSWCSFAPSFKKRSRAGVTSMGRHLFAIGGYNESKELSSGEFYDPIINCWEPLSQDMGTKRSCLATASLNGLVYVAGGYDGASCLSSVERFDPLSDTWSSVEAMVSRRRHGRLTVLDGCLYAVGGYDGTNYQSSMERYDPREGKWQLMPPMTNRRSSSGVATLDGKIYAAGGNDGTLCMNSVERFDPTRNTWEMVSPMHTRRSTHDVVEADGYLYSIGGNDGSSSLNTVERYELKGNRWIPISSMMLRRSSVGAAVLECPNMEKILEALTHQAAETIQ